VKLTPELLLERGGIDISSISQAHNTVDEVRTRAPKTVWPKVSEYWTAGIDGTGSFVNLRQGAHFAPIGKSRGGIYRQDLGGQIELESANFRPHEVPDSPFVTDLQVTLDKLQAAKEAHVGQDWYKIPFADAKGIKIHGGMHATEPCTKCHTQWTPGLALRHVTSLLRLANSTVLQAILSRVDDLCEAHRNRCKKDYQGFIALSAWALTATQQSKDCGHPKRYMVPWLVRTHFGDMAMLIKEKYGAKTFKRAASDILRVGNLQAQSALLPNGTIDYLKLPEMAELSGMVHSRNPSLRKSHKETEQDMPTTVDGLLQLSKKMLHYQDLINNRMRARRCRLHSKDNINARKLTVQDWLDGMQNGKDLMSDHDSPLSESAFSHMVWKSMGNWRMKPGSDRVYLECRDTGFCLNGLEPQPGPAALINYIGHKMIDFEKTMQKTPADERVLTRKAKQRSVEVGHNGQLVRSEELDAM